MNDWTSWACPWVCGRVRECVGVAVCVGVAYSPSLGLTKPLVTPRLFAATVSPLTTRSRVNSEDSVCITMGRSRSRTWGGGKRRCKTAGKYYKNKLKNRVKKIGWIERTGVLKWRPRVWILIKIYSVPEMLFKYTNEKMRKIRWYFVVFLEPNRVIKHSWRGMQVVSRGWPFMGQNIKLAHFLFLANTVSLAF